MWLLIAMVRVLAVASDFLATKGKAIGQSGLVDFSNSNPVLFAVPLVTSAGSARAADGPLFPGAQYSAGDAPNFC